jgi:signal transduction histidine kinase
MGESRRDTRREEEGAGLERRLAELGLLYNLGKSFSAVLNLSELLTRVVEAAVSLTRAEEGLILLPDPETGELTIGAARNVDDEIVRELRLPGETSLAGQVMKTGEPILIRAADGRQKIKTKYLVRSLLYVPLIVKGRVTGVLGVDNQNAPGDFTPRDQDMLSALGGYAAIAIENAQLFEDAVQHARELQTLVQTADAVSSSLEFGRVLAAVSRQLKRGLGVHWCIISAWDQEDNCLHRLAEHREAVWPKLDGPSYSLTDYPHLARLLEGGEPISWSLGHPKYLTAEAERLVSRGVGRALAVPLQVAGNIIGFVELLGLRGDVPFSAAAKNRVMREALGMASLFAGGASGHEMALLSSAGDLIATTDGDWCAAYIWDREAGLIRQVLESGTSVWPEEPGGMVEVVEGRRLKVALREQRIDSVRIGDLYLHPAERAMLARVGAGAMLVFPLVFQGKTVGLIRLFDLRPTRVFSGREMNMASAIANQAAIALENARLYRDLERSLSDLRRTQSQLVQSARLSALGELAAAVAHQINNPLTTVLGDAEILAEDLPPDHPNYESVQAILRAGRRAREVVSRLLTMARHDDDLTLLSVNQTIEEALLLTGPLITRQAIALDVALAEDLPPVAGVPAQLEDVWLSLLTNARDAIPQGREGRIAIRSCLSVDESAVLVLVEDNGTGISPEHQEKVFTQFFTTKPRGKGTGLGLYICHHIVTQHGGGIEITSQPGKGTCVKIWLPVAEGGKEAGSGVHSGC